MGDLHRKFLLYILLGFFAMGSCFSPIEHIMPPSSIRPPDALLTPAKESVSQETNISTDTMIAKREAQTDPEDDSAVVLETGTNDKKIEDQSEEVENAAFLTDLKELEEAAEDPALIIPVDDHVKVDRYLNLFQKSQKRWMRRALKRSNRYIDRMQEILREEGLPEDLVYLALFDERISARAYTRAHEKLVYVP